MSTLKTSYANFWSITVSGNPWSMSLKVILTYDQCGTIHYTYLLQFISTRFKRLPHYEKKKMKKHKHTVRTAN